MCVSSPIYLVITGNMGGARLMLPYPDFRAGDQRGAPARTSVGKNSDNDNQDCDMPS